MTNPTEFVSSESNRFGAESLLPSAEAVTLIDPDGTALQNANYKSSYELPDVPTLIDGLERLSVARRINEQAGALVRQGRLAVYPSSRGQEACQVAVNMVLGSEDWLFPTYRDTVAIIGRGIDPLQAFKALRGDWHSGYNPKEYRTALPATPLATQLLHAVGVAHAAKLRGEDTVVIALCGDGASSEGDFHEALNFAAVFHVPVIFLIQNNGYAISVPLIHQSVAPSLAHKAIGYGMPGERVDGNDLAALLAVLNNAVTRARNGGGPALIEAHTYRIEAHTNADDATRYRSADEVEQWKAKDPLTRLSNYLGNIGAVDDERLADFKNHADSVATQMREGLNIDHPLDPLELFDHVYASPTPQLLEQRELLRQELAAGHVA